MSTPPCGPVTCSSCDTVVAEVPLTGMLERDPARGTSWVCGDCLRRNVRAVEAKLEREWW